MTPDRTDQQMNLTTATLTSDYVVVTAHGRSGVYKTQPGKGPTERTGTLVHSTDGDAAEFVAALEVTGASVEHLTDALHLLGADGFPDAVDFAAPVNTESVLVAEIARLNAQADKQDRDDALGGGYGNAGSGTRAKAEAFTEALALYRQYG